MQDIDFLPDDKDRKDSYKKKDPYVEYTQPTSSDTDSKKDKGEEKKSFFYHPHKEDGEKKEAKKEDKPEKEKKQKIKRIKIKKVKEIKEIKIEEPKPPKKERKPFFSFLRRNKRDKPKKSLMPEKEEPVAPKNEPIFPAIKKELTKLPAPSKKPEINIKKPEIEKERPLTFDVNLIPEEFLDELRPARKIKIIIITAIVCCLVVFITYGLIYIYQSRVEGKIEGLNKQIAEIDKEIATYQKLKKEVERINQVAEKVDELLDGHIYWTQFFELLEKYTIEDVYYRSMIGNVTGSFVLSATAKNYEDVSRQIEVFRQADDFIESVEVSSATTSQITVKSEEEGNEELVEQRTSEVVNFDISLTAKPDIFYFKK